MMEDISHSALFLHSTYSFFLWFAILGMILCARCSECAPDLSLNSQDHFLSGRRPVTPCGHPVIHARMWLLPPNTGRPIDQLARCAFLTLPLHSSISLTTLKRSPTPFYPMFGPLQATPTTYLSKHSKASLSFKTLKLGAKIS